MLWLLPRQGTRFMQRCIDMHEYMSFSKGKNVSHNVRKALFLKLLKTAKEKLRFESRMLQSDPKRSHLTGKKQRYAHAYKDVYKSFRPVEIGILYSG